MSLTIKLPPDAEERLRADAAGQGRAPEDLAAEHLAAMYTQDDDLDQALQEAFVQLEAGEGESMEDFANRLRGRADTRAIAEKAA